jgi:hypothetical protein
MITIPALTHRLFVLLAGVFLSGSLVHAWAEFQPIKNDTVWLDTNGHEVCAQGGSMMKLGDTCYWYGFDGAIPAPKSGVPMYKGVNCYSSKDLSRWKLENTIFQLAQKVPNRLEVVYSPALKKYVILSKHMDFKKGIGVSTCETPTGNFEWQGWLELPDSMGGGDQSIFIDEDGKTYAVYTPWRSDPGTNKVETNRHLSIVELTPDCLKVARVVCQQKKHLRRGSCDLQAGRKILLDDIPSGLVVFIRHLMVYGR